MDCKNDGLSNKDLSSSLRKSGICVFEISTFDNSAYHLLSFQCRYESLENSLSSHAYVQCTSKEINTIIRPTSYPN